MGMPKKKWTRVDSAKEIRQIEPGGYVCSIVDVYYDRRSKRLEVRHDVAEGPLAGFFRDQPKKVSTRKYVIDGPGDAFFKSFLEVLEDSNPQFSIYAWEDSCEERDLIGLKFGALMQTLHYEKDGEQRTLVEMAEVVPADKVRRGDFTLPAPRVASQQAEKHEPVGRPSHAPEPYREHVPLEAYGESLGAGMNAGGSVAPVTEPGGIAHRADGSDVGRAPSSDDGMPPWVPR